MKKLIRQIILTFIILSTACFGQTNQTDTAKISIQTKKLLVQPYDLNAYKKKKKDSNSSSAVKEPYFLKPDKGVYWHFMLFRFGNGYIGSVPSKDLFLENGIEIITFQPPGKYQNKYTNPDETLIQTTLRYNDIDLPELAFVGIDTNKIIKKLGQPDLEKSNCFIYFHDKNILTLHIKNGKTNWLKYTRLNFIVTKDNIPADLLADKWD
jgi:hypothetical protein